MCFSWNEAQFDSHYVPQTLQREFMVFKKKVSKLSYIFWTMSVGLFFLSEFSNEYGRPILEKYSSQG